MRQGALIGDYETRQTNPEALADAMVGRKVAMKVDKGPAAPGRAILTVRNLDIYDDRGACRVFGVSFDIRAGEIVGIAGVAGNGQSELLEALAGMRRPSAGQLMIDGEAIDFKTVNPRAMRARGVLHVPEDRLREGLVAPFEACESAMLGFQHDEAYGAMLLDRGEIERSMAQSMEAYDVRPRAPRLATRAFSGGNQQKIVLAREIERNPKALLVGQPTRGVDIGAIEFIHRRLIALRDAGAAILLVSVELDEIMALADRILVMCAGRITGERNPNETDARDLGLLMAGVTERAA
jgi:simple sugar transport system ATP-binding protein